MPNKLFRLCVAILGVLVLHTASARAEEHKPTATETRELSLSVGENQTISSQGVNGFS